MVSRTGTVLDIPTILIITFILIVSVLMSVTILDQIITSTNDDQLDQDILQQGKDALALYDKGIIVVFIGLFMFTILTSVKIPTNPVFFFPALLFLSITIWISATFSNILWQFVNVEPILSTVNNSFPTLVVFIENWPIVTGAFGLVVLIALYLKAQRVPEAGI